MPLWGGPSRASHTCRSLSATTSCRELIARRSFLPGGEREQGGVGGSPGGASTGRATAQVGAGPPRPARLQPQEAGRGVCPPGPARCTASPLRPRLQCHPAIGVTLPSAGFGAGALSGGRARSLDWGVSRPPACEIPAFSCRGVGGGLLSSPRSPVPGPDPWRYSPDPARPLPETGGCGPPAGAPACDPCRDSGGGEALSGGLGRGRRWGQARGLLGGPQMRPRRGQW